MFIRTISFLHDSFASKTFNSWDEIVDDVHALGHSVIVTHGDKFHADELLAAALIIKLCPENFVVIRTRTLPTNLHGKDWVVDVGDGKYDHHEKDRETYPNGVKKAACGKVAEVLLREDPKTLEKLQRMLLWAVEAQDNGQSLQELGLPPSKLSFVSTLLPTWNAPQFHINSCFTKALDMTRIILASILDHIVADDKAEAVLEAVQDDEIVVLPKFVPWTAWAVEKWPKARFVVFPSSNGKGFNAQAVPLTATPGDFRNRGGFPDAWGGLRDEALAEVSGIPGAIFCHAGLFLGVWDTQEHAIEAAKAAIAATQVVVSP
jgi:uncharacterized UPF0160 family protein